MIYFVLFSLILIFLCCFAIVFIFKKYLDEKNNLENILNYLKKLNYSVNSVRYGNFNARIDNGFNEFTNLLSANLNDMFESIADREIMIREYIEKEKENNLLKSDFIATLTHDLKVPIIAQDNTFELFLNKKFGEISNIQEEAIKKMKISNIDLKHLVEALLETYKMEQASIKLNIKKDVNLHLLMKDVLNQISSIFELHDIKVNYINNIGEDFLCDIDQFLIKRVLQNLLLNALSHSKKSGSVDIETNLLGDKKFSIKVQDYGCGILKDEIDKIFKKYYSGSTKFEKVGTGLGLYLSNRIVKLHKGKIEVQSEENKGSSFTVVLSCKAL